MATEIVRRNVIVEYQQKSKEFRKDQDALGKSTKGLGKIFSSVKGQLTAFLTIGAAIAIFKDATKTISEFQVSLKELQSLTGLGESVLDELGDKAINMSLKFGTSAKDIVDGFAKVGSAAPQLLDDADALAEVTAQADILSKAAGITLDQAIDALTKSMNQYGLEASEAATVTDILATSQQKGTARITDLTQALKNVGSVAAAQGISFENTNAHLQALAKGGLSGAEAGTKLRAIYLALAKTGRDELNPATQDFNDILKILGKEVKTVNKAQTLFGKQNAAAALTLIKQADTVAKLTDNLNEVGNALDQATINTDTAASAWGRAGATWDALILSIDKGDGVLSNISKKIADDSASILTAFKLLNDGLIKSFDDFANATGGTLEQRAAFIEKLQKLNATPETGRRIGGIDQDAAKDVEIYTSQIAILSSQIKNDLTPGTKEYEFALGDLEFAQERLADAQSRLNAERNKSAEAAAAEANTLGALKLQLTEAKKARDQITEGDIVGLQANERLIVSLQKRIKAMSVATKKTGDFAKEQIEAAQAIDVLRVALIEDDFERSIAAIELRGKQEIEAVKGTEEQKATQRLLIRLRTERTILKLHEERLKEEAEKEKEFLANQQEFLLEDAERREEKLKEMDEQESAARELGFQKEILAIKQQVQRKEITEQEGVTKIAKIQIDALKAQLQNLSLTGAERVAVKQAIVDAEIALEQKLTDETKKQFDERMQLVGEAVGLISNILTEVFKAEQDRIEKSISLQEERVSKARQLADKGNAELLQLEEDRLERLNRAREKAAKKQRAIQAAQIIANAALTISSTITGITRSFAEGGIYGVIAGGISLAATLAAAIIGVRNALSDVPAYAEGIDSLNGAGNGKSDSIPARLSKGERVVPAAANKKLVAMGVTNKNIVGIASAGIEAIQAPALSNSAIPATTDNNSNGFKGLENEIQLNTQAIENLGVSATIDENGFTAAIGKRNKFRERRKKLLK